MLCRIYKKNISQRPMDRDKDDSMEALLSSLPPSSMVGGHREQTMRCANYGAVVEHEEISFEGILMTGQGIQGLQSRSISQHWNGEGSIGLSSSGKCLHTGPTGGVSSADQMDGNSSFVSLLNQLPQSGTFHQNTLLGSLADGANYRQTYQFPSMNWNS